MSNELEIREMKVAEITGRTFKGLAVPYDTDTLIGGVYTERIERGAIKDYDTKIFWRHSEPIGRITSAQDTKDGWEIEGSLSDTPRGNEAATLLRDGVVDALSIGFIANETRQDKDVYVRTNISVREVSLVPHGAYSGARVSEVREDTTKEQEVSEMETNSNEDLVELRGAVEDLERSVALLGTSASNEVVDPASEFDSYGDYVRAAVLGDERAIELHNRAGELVTSDTIAKDSWLGSLIHELQAKQPVKNAFKSGPLPSSGLGVEYGVLSSDTTQVAEQVNELDALAFGKIAVATERAGIKTFGGWSSLSRQAIERSTNVSILDQVWSRLARRAARAEETYVRSVVTAGLATAPELVGTYATADEILTLLVDLNEHYNDSDFNLDGIFVSSDVFKSIALVAEDRKVLQVTGVGTDKLGTVSVGSLSANIASIPVTVFPGAATGTIFAYDRNAVRTLTSGGPTRLQDEDITTLRKDVSVYFYASSFVAENDGLVNVVATAGV